MTNEDKPDEIVIEVSRVSRFGTDYIVCTPMRVHGSEAHPSNLSWTSFGDGGKEYADLELSAYVSDDGRYTHLCGPEYRTVHSVDMRHAETMVKVLGRIGKAIAKAEAHEAGDVFMAFARCIGAKRIVWHPEGQRASWLRDFEWHFETLAGGRDRFRRLIGEMESTHPKIAIRQSA
jgi:hypothetical protein